MVQNFISILIMGIGILGAVKTLEISDAENRKKELL